MTGSELLSHFDTIATAPGGVARLRELVLQLAVQGKLVPQDARDGGTTNWEMRSLGTLGIWGTGGTPSSKTTEYYDGGITWLKIGDLNNGLVTSSEQTITQVGYDNCSTRMIPAGSVLIALYGASIGKAGIAGVECCTNQAIAHCIPDPKICSSEYVFLMFRALRSQLVAKGQGAAQPNISQRILKAIAIKLPPLAEQQRIVAKVDELLALCDELETHLTQQETTATHLATAAVQTLAS